MKIEGLVIGDEIFDIPKHKKYLKRIKNKNWKTRRNIKLNELHLLSLDTINNILEAQEEIKKNGSISNCHQRQIDKITDNVLKMVSVLFTE